MARLFTSGFERNAATAEWTSGFYTPDATTARTGTRSGTTLPTSGTPVGYAEVFAASAVAGPLFCRFYLRRSFSPSVDTTCFALSTVTGIFSNVSTSDVCVKMTTTGAVALYNGTTQIGSNSPVLASGVWYRIEVQFDNSPASGSKVLRMRIDGAVIAESATLTAMNGDVKTMSVGSNLAGEAQTGSDYLIDDVAINDATGTLQNSWPGDGKVITLVPTGQGESNQWSDTANSAGTSNNYTLVDENPQNDATDYVQTGTAGNIDLYTFPASGIGANDTVNCVQVLGRHANNTADATTAYALLIEKASGGTKQQGASIVPNRTFFSTGSATNANTSLTYASLTAHTDPDGVAWTQATVDTLRAGPKLVTAGTNRIQVTSVWVTVDYTPAGPQYRTGTSGLVSSGTLNLTVPAFTQAGDVMVLSTVYKATAGTGTITTPSGWTALATGVDFSGASANSSLWIKTAAGTPGSLSTDAGTTVALVPTGGTQQLNAVLEVYANADPTPRDWGFADQGASASTTVTVPAETTSSTDRVLLIATARGSANGTVTFSAPSNGYTIRHQSTATSGAAQDVALFIADGSASGTQTATANLAVWQVTGQVVLRSPVPAAPPTVKTLSALGVG